jgi:hypothetical protein
MKTINSFFYNIYDHLYLAIIQELEHTIDNIYVKRVTQVWFTFIISLALIGISYAVWKVFILHLIFGISL